MTDVEALLSVDAGHVPQGTVAFFAADPEAGERRDNAIRAAVAGSAALVCGLCGAGRVLVALLVLTAAVLAVLATPTVVERAKDEPAAKRHVMVVTRHGLIVRDAWGLRSWRFDDLADVVAWTHERRPHLVLVARDGKRHALDHLSFHRGEHLREVIGHRLKPQST